MRAGGYLVPICFGFYQLIKPVVISNEPAVDCVQGGEEKLYALHSDKLVWMQGVQDFSFALPLFASSCSIEMTIFFY